MNEVKVLNSALQLDDKTNDYYLLCLMSDGSSWRCNTQGENWVKLQLTIDELTNKFNVK